MTRVLEGQWNDLVRRQDLQGHTVRVIVLDPDEKGDPGRWLSELTRWADSHPPVASAVDDTREGIYSGTIDDPR